MGSRCNAQTLNPAAMPYWSKNKWPATPPKQASPFEELLKPCPQAIQALPNNRPKRLSYHLDRDQATLSELSKLASGVVFDTHGHEYNFSLKDVVGFATRTKLVQSSEISIGRLAKDRFLIMLPHGMAPQTFIEGTTPELWDAGFSFQPWSELDGANTVLPEYKVLIDLHNIPPHLFRDKQVQKVVSTFGTYLGSIPPVDIADLSVWTAVVAVNRLEKVPEELTLYELGSEHIISIQPRNWLRSPLYKATDLPRHQQKFTKPLKARSDHQADNMEHFAVSRRALREMCKGLDSSALPEEIRAILQETGPNPTISMAGVEQLASLPRTAEPLTLTNSETGETSHPHPLRDPSHNLTQFVTQPIQQDTIPFPPETTEVPQLHEAGQIFSTNAGASELDFPEMPQRIPTQVQILKRQPPRTVQLDSSPARRDRSVPEASVQRINCGNVRRQIKNRDKPVGPKNRTRAVPADHKEKGKQTVNADGPAQKSRKGVPVLIPPKPVLFKKLAQQKFTGGPKNTKNKQAAQRAAELVKGPDGFFEVAVHYSHCQDLADGLGLKPGDVEEVLMLDNLQRKEGPQADSGSADVEMDEEGLDMEFESDEDVLSDDEPAQV